MRKLACLVALGAVALAPAQSFNLSPAVRSFQTTTGQTSWSGSAYYDVHLKHASMVIFNKFGDLTIHGKPIGIEVSGFVGAQNSKGTPATIGVAALWHHQLVDQIDVIFGLGGSMTGGKWGGGPILGASIRF